MSRDTSLAAIKTALKQQAFELGFQAVGITDAEIPTEDAAHLKRWLEQGYHGTMEWMATTGEKRADPRAFFPEAESVLIAAYPYFRSREPLQPPPDTGNISLYARGRDYHKVLRKKLKQLLNWLKQKEPGVQGRIFVDSFPILERALAQKAGLGWIGKNAMLILKGKGSWYFLGGILLNLPLPPDKPLTTDYCGTCNRCLTACPTQAIVAPGQVDARRCISYLTIEHEGEIDAEFHSAMGNSIFGCDICQQVCPWNRFASDTPETDFFSRFSPEELKLNHLQHLPREEFERMFEGTPVRRAGHRRFLRNVQIALTNLRKGRSTNQ